MAAAPQKKKSDQLSNVILRSVFGNIDSMTRNLISEAGEPECIRG